MTRIRLIGLALALGVSSSLPVAHAQVFKCLDERKQPVYQDKPCAAGTEVRNFETDPATVSVIPMRPPPGTTSRIVAPPRVKTPTPGKPDKVRLGDPGERRYIHLGMNEGEVIARIGPADITSGGKGRKLSRWTYMPALGDAQTITTVVFDYGKVIEVERKVVK
ncbi:MAG: DUF4124 domain-containing protein [Betaproteobacteria bacterium]